MRFRINFALLIFAIVLVTLPPSFGQNKTDVDSLLEKGTDKAKLSKYEEAISYFDLVLQIEPTNVLALTYKGDALIELERYEEAISYFDMILQIEPTNVLFLSKKGSALIELERYEEAISYFDFVLQIEPTNVLALTHKGVALGDLERYEEAISYFDLVLYIDPTNVVAQENSKITFEKIGTVPADDSKYYAYVQIQLLNSANELIGFIESDAIFYLPHQLTDEFVESFPVMKTVERNGKVFEFREIILTNQVDKDTGFAITEILLTISGVPISVFKAFTHGYIISSDDTVITSWKIMKSVTD